MFHHLLRAFSRRHISPSGEGETCRLLILFSIIKFIISQVKTSYIFLFSLLKYITYLLKIIRYLFLYLIMYNVYLQYIHCNCPLYCITFIIRLVQQQQKCFDSQVQSFVCEPQKFLKLYFSTMYLNNTKRRNANNNLTITQFIWIILHIDPEDPTFQ